MPDNLHKGKAPVVVHGPSLLHKPEGMEFRPDRPFTYCRVCGEIYQPNLNRLPDWEYTMEVVLAAEITRRNWSQRHAKTHSDTQHRQLATSGRHCTPEALQKLVPMGIIPASDIALDEESEQAGLEVGRMPSDDVEGAKY